jgi:hypothetical protein
MAVVQLESLVLRGIHDACNVVLSLERNGSARADGRTPTVSLSLPRFLMRYPHPGMDPGERRGNAEDLGVAAAAARAGRPGSASGVPGSRGLAITARRTIQSRWSPAERGACATAWRPDPFTVRTRASLGQPLSGRLLAFQRSAVRGGGRIRPSAQPGHKRAKEALA